MDQRGRDFLAENSCVASTLACREQEQQAQNRSTCHRHFSEIDLVYANVEYCGATFGTSTTSGLKLLPRVSFQGSKNVNARLPRDYQLSARPVHLHNCIRRSRASAKGKGDVVWVWLERSFFHGLRSDPHDWNLTSIPMMRCCYCPWSNMMVCRCPCTPSILPKAVSNCEGTTQKNTTFAPPAPIPLANGPPVGVPTVSSMVTCNRSCNFENCLRPFDA